MGFFNISTGTSFSGVNSGPRKGLEEQLLTHGIVARAWIGTRGSMEKDEKAEAGTLGKKVMSVRTGMCWATKSWRE